MADIEKMFSELVDNKINEHHYALIRRMGGLPVNSNGFLIEKANIEANILTTGEGFDADVMKATMELLTAFNAMSHLDEKQKATVTLHFSLLSSSRPLSALTGEDREWVKAGDKEINVRDPRVVRKDGKAYFTQAYAFEKEGKRIFDGEKSWSEVSFPLEVSKLKTELQKN